MSVLMLSFLKANKCLNGKATKISFSFVKKKKFIVLLIRSVKADMQDHTISIYLLSEDFSSLRGWITLIIQLDNHVNVLLYLHFKVRKNNEICLSWLKKNSLFWGVYLLINRYPSRSFLLIQLRVWFLLKYS